MPNCWNVSDPLYASYHDEEWGTPVHDDRLLFEFLSLEGFQAGLSWRQILERRDAFRRAFNGFDPARVAVYTDKDVERLLGDRGIVRNRKKIEATINNAWRVLEVQRTQGSFDAYVWGFVGGETRNSGLRTLKEMPSETEESRAMNRDLKKKGFKFVGPTICYSFMQAVGLVNDHLVTCPRYMELTGGKGGNF